jgi:hypothetical protein
MTCAADLRILCRRQLTSNLPAGVPEGRAFSSSSAAFFDGFVPSGTVPGGGAAGRVCELRRELGGDGPDCFPLICCRVLFAFSEDYLVIPNFQKVLLVICKATALN